MLIRKASHQDVSDVERLYNEVHTAEENGDVFVGWDRKIYPTKATAEMAVIRSDLFVQEDEGVIVGTAVINQIQDPSYEGAGWSVDAPEDEVMVLHTLVISPTAGRRGYGRAFVDFYEKYALKNGCRYLRMDTNERNVNARALYKKLGYVERDIVECNFNGLNKIHLVLLEKNLVK